MEPIPAEDGPFDVGVGCCITRNQRIAISTSPPKPKPKPKPKQSGLKARLPPAVPSSLVKGSKFLKAKIAGGDKARDGRDDRHRSRSPPRSAAHQHFRQPAQSPTPPKSPPRSPRTVERMDIPPPDEEDAATAESSHPPVEELASPEEQLALDIGQNAHEYLEECFYTEAGVLSREKFNALPQIYMEDFQVMSFLGKGNFSDVHHVVRADGMPSGDLGNGMAMKSLRPQVMEDEEQFEIGSEDLVHETALLANLTHRHIIKIHGRRVGHLTEAFLDGSYFIFLDKLNETLFGRMGEWKQERDDDPHAPLVEQLEVGRAIADAMAYLHSRNIVFRDLKPDNVGFDAAGVLKLFDFGFATGLPAKDADNPEGFLYDRCGTPRYMAPEVGFELGYDEAADVYSIGVLLWEMCALEKPFAEIRCSNEFDRMVFMGGLRPKLNPRWPKPVSTLMCSCWSATPSMRPSMAGVKSALSSSIGNSPRSGMDVR